MSMWEWVIVFSLGSMIANIALRIVLGKAYFLHRALISQGYEKGYEEGYWDGCTNIKMYHALMSNKIRPSDWLTKTMGSRLDTRDKMTKVLNK